MTNSPLRPVLLASVLLAPTLTLAGCSDRGTHILTIAGSERVVDGVTTVDEWDVSFEQLVVVVHNPGLIERIDNEPAWVREPGVTIWDVTETVADDEGLSQGVRATAYDGADFRIAPASESGYAALAGNVEAGVVTAAVADDWSIRVVGSATHAVDGTITFDWAFATSTFHRCKFEGDEVVEIGADGEETTVIEILGDALLREMGQELNPDADLNFGTIADADADGDGEVTKAELESAGQWERLEELTREFGAVRGSDGCDALDE